MSDALGGHLAQNIKNLRRARGLTQQQLARVAGMPRATWSHLESGDANPTLSVLTRAATALQVRLEELLAPPRASAQFVPADQLFTRRRGDVSVRKLLPEALPGLEIERMTLPAGAQMAGVPHTEGTREYLTCERGQVELRVAGEHYRLDPGDVVVFRGDQKHGYHNPARSESVAYSVIALVPPGH